MHIPLPYHHFGQKCKLGNSCKWCETSKTRLAIHEQMTNSKYEVCLQPISKPIRAAIHPPYPLMCKLAKWQMIHFKLNQLSTWINNAKQKYISFISAQSNPRHSLHRARNPHSLILAFLHIYIFLPKAPKTLEHSCFLHVLTTIWKLFELANTNWK